MVERNKTIKFGPGAGGGFMALAVIGLVIFCAALLIARAYLATASGVNQTAAERHYAQADEYRAQTGLEAQRGVNFQHEFMLWSTALAAFGAHPLTGALGIVVLAAVALGTGYWIGISRHNYFEED